MPEDSLNQSAEQFKRAQAELLQQFDSRANSRYINLPEPPVRVHLLEAGMGETVILIHRSGGVAVGWLPLLSALEAHFHIIAPDNPGSGLSDKRSYRGVDLRGYAVEFLKSLMDSLGVSKAAFVGNSIGGYFSLLFAIAYPERVSKIVVVGAMPGIDKSIPKFIRLLGTRGINRLLHATVLTSSLESTRELFRRILVANLIKVPPLYLQCAYLSRVIPGADLSWLTMLEQLVTFRGLRKKYLISDEMPRIKQPVLFLWGENDWFAPPSVGERACRILPKGRIEVLHDAGHLPWLDQPESSAELVVQFLKVQD